MQSVSDVFEKWPRKFHTNGFGFGGSTSPAVTPRDGAMPSCKLSKLSIWLEFIVPHSSLVGVISTLEPFKSDVNGSNVSLESLWSAPARGENPAGIGCVCWSGSRVRIEGEG